MENSQRTKLPSLIFNHGCYIAGNVPTRTLYQSSGINYSLANPRNMLSSSSFQAGYWAVGCPPDLEKLRLGKHKPFIALPTAETHDTAESNSEFTIATATGVLKPMPFLQNPRVSDFIYSNDYWNPHSGSMGHIQSKVIILDAVDKTIQFLKQIWQDSSQNCVTIQVSWLVHGICRCYNT